MRTIFRFIPVAILIAILSGCAAQKKAVVTAESEILHQQALKALEDRRFIIQAKEFYLPGGEPVQYSTDSYMTMRDKDVVIKFSQKLFTKYYHSSNLTGQNAEDHAATMIREKDKKSGDLQFCIKIMGDGNNKNRKIEITLYKNTNNCYVCMSNDLLGYQVVNFKGCILPLND